MPGPGARPTLIVTGKVTVPTGGYRFEWRDMRVMESYPVQIAVDLQPIPPDRDPRPRRSSPTTFAASGRSARRSAR